MDDDTQFEDILDGVEVSDKKVFDRNSLDAAEAEELAQAFVV